MYTERKHQQMPRERFEPTIPGDQAAEQHTFFTERTPRGWRPFIFPSKGVNGIEHRIKVVTRE
jgi:hypothetical protein